VQIVGCERSFEQQVGAGNAGVEVAYSGRVVCSWAESFGEVIDELALLVDGEVFDGVDELRCADLGDRYRGERKDL
jgi:hypothetical protein